MGGFFKNPGAIWRLPPKKRAGFLQGLGYDVDIDGRSSPELAATAWGWSKGMSPGLVNDQEDPWFQTVWDQHFAKRNKRPNSKPRDGHMPPTANVVRQAPAVEAVIAARRRGGAAPPPSVRRNTPAPRRAPAGPVSPGFAPTNTAAGAPFGLPPANFIDPRKFATGAANSEFGPQIADMLRSQKGLVGDVDEEFGPQIAALLRAQESARNQYQQAIKDVQGWNAEALGGYDASTTKGVESDQAALASFDQAGQNLGAAFGGAANDSLGSAAAISGIARSGLQAEQQNQGDYRQNMRDALVRSATDDQQRLLREGISADSEFGDELLDLKGQRGRAISEGREEIAGRLSDLRGARGAAWNEAFQSATAQRNQQGRDRLQDSITAALAADEVKAGTLANKAAGQQIDMNNIRIAMGLDQTEEGGTPRWGQVDPGQRAQLRDQLLSTLVNENGQLAVNPMQAFNRMGHALRSVSNGQWNPFNNQEVSRWRNALLQEMLPQWNRAHPNRKYVFKNGKIVFKGKK